MQPTPKRARGERHLESAEQRSPGPCLSPDKLRGARAGHRAKGSGIIEQPTGTANEPRKQPEPDSSPFQLLGFNKGTYYYLPRGQKQVISLSASGHIERQLLTLAPRDWWLRTFEKPPSRKGGDPTVDWAKACSWLYEMQHLQGVYDPRRIRGRGCWIDADRVVIHLGERVICDGSEVEVGRCPALHLEQGAALAGPLLDQPMGVDEARERSRPRSCAGGSIPHQPLCSPGG